MDTSQIRQFTPDIERFQMMDCGIYPHRDGGIWTEFLFQATTATGSTENRRTRGIMYEKPKKGEEPIDENGEIVQVDTRKGYYSDDIAHTFGVPMEQYKKETDVKEMDGFVEIAMLTGAREKKGSDSTDNQDKASTGDPEQLSTPTQPDQ